MDKEYIELYESNFKEFVMEKLNKGTLKEEQEVIDKAKVDLLISKVKEDVVEDNEILTVDDVLDVAYEEGIELNQRELDYIELILL